MKKRKAHKSSAEALNSNCLVFWPDNNWLLIHLTTIKQLFKVTNANFWVVVGPVTNYPIYCQVSETKIFHFAFIYFALFVSKQGKQYTTLLFYLCLWHGRPPVYNSFLHDHSFHSYVWALVLQIHSFSSPLPGSLRAFGTLRKTCHTDKWWGKHN